MLKIITATWSFDSNKDFQLTPLYKSFIKKNRATDLINIHFNRSLFIDLENQFSERFGYQYEYILYKIFLLKSEIQQINCEHIIFCDANDVACLIDLQTIDVNQYVQTGVTFSSEINQYPSREATNNWPNNSYTDQKYLNSGLFIGTKQYILQLIDEVVDKVLPLNFKNFGGDQGVYTYYYLNHQHNEVKLDKQNEFFLSTYLTSWGDFQKVGDRVVNKSDSTAPSFIHDNGWNYGSPKFIEKFNLA